MATCLSAQGVQKRYGGFLALQDASLEMRQGEILALLGPNGAGKTTLIKILATLLTRDGGRVEILGLDLDRHPEEIRHLFGYVGQDTERSAYARLTVVENLRFFGALRGLGRKLVDRQIEELAAAFEFHGNLDKQFVTLSGGQKQTVVIMRALLHDPPLVYLDEPTKGLDPIIARRIRAFLVDFVRREGKSILLTSHILAEVDQMADRVALIHRGTVPIVGTPAELKLAVGATEFVEVQDNLPPPVLDRLRHLEPVLCALEREPGWISFGVTDPMAGAEAIIGALREAEIATGFRHHTVTLEDAFLHHIGELAEKFEQ
jgi:ABC-2 type transport system ATP-binding protein